MRKRKIKYLVIIPILFVIIITLSIPFIISEYRLNIEIEKLHQKGIPVTPQEFNNIYYKPVSESKNAAATFNEAHALCPKLDTQLLTASLESRIHYNLSPEILKTARKCVKKNTAFFNEIEKMQKYKIARFNIKFTEDYEMDYSEQYGFLAIIRPYALKTELAIENKDPQQVKMLLCKMFHIASLANQTPGDTGQVITYGCENLILKKLERAMNKLSFSPEQLESLSNNFDDCEQHIVRSWPIIWKYELVCLLTNKNKLLYDSCENVKEKSKYAFLRYSGVLTSVLIKDIKILEKIINIPVEAYIKQKDNLERIEYEIGPGFVSLPQSLYLIMSKAIARLRCAKTACAVECFRLKYGELPEKLKQLVPEFLERVPTDPFDGKSLRYFRNNFNIRYEVQIKAKKKPEISEIANIFRTSETPQKPEYKFLNARKAGFQVYSVGENLRDEKSSLILDKHSSGEMFRSGIQDDIIFTVIDK